MTKKIDVQGIIEGLTQAKAESLIRSKNGRVVPLVIVRNARVQCTAADIISFNEREMISIKALIAWTAIENKMSETAVVSWLTTWADVESIDQIPQHRYDDVIRFLVDLKLQAN